MTVTTSCSACRKLPLLSEMLLFPLTLTGAMLHVVTSPLGIEPTVSALMMGGLFGLILVPVTFAAVSLYLIENAGLFPGASSFLTTWLGIPFALCYVVQVLILDKSHLSVKNASVHPPRNAVERASVAFFNAVVDYFPITCVPWAKDASLPTTRQYIFAVHPHGIHGFQNCMLSVLGSAFDKHFPGLVGSKLSGLIASVMFKIPVVREAMISTGHIDASRSVADKALSAGRSLFVVTGGEEESMYTTMGKDIVVLKNRKGFVRLALAHGADLVPVFGAGNSDVFKTYSLFSKQRQWIQKNLKMAFPIFHGRFLTPLPYKRPIKVLIGEPIRTPTPKVRGEKPDESLVDEYHAKYIAALATLHAKHVKDRQLEIR